MPAAAGHGPAQHSTATSNKSVLPQLAAMSGCAWLQHALVRRQFDGLGHDAFRHKKESMVLLHQLSKIWLIDHLFVLFMPQELKHPLLRVLMAVGHQALRHWGVRAA